MANSARNFLGQRTSPMRRPMRNPVHPFHLKVVPWVIQPFLLAPVLPNDTLKNALLQYRTVTDPIKNRLTGWWCEYYLFYVKLRDLAERDELESMILDPNWSNSNIDEAAQDDSYYFAGAGVNWSKLCLQRVVEEYFRGEGEAWTDFVVAQNGTNMPIASTQVQSWLDSAMLEQEHDDNDVNVPLLDSDTVAGNDAFSMTAFEEARERWQLAQLNGITQMTFEDFCSLYGVQGMQKEEPHKPELLRFERDWQYPSNTIVPTTGAATSAVSWAGAVRADKDRLFKEPGFIFGVHVVRPKVYYRNQIGSAAWIMDNLRQWLPAGALNDPNIGLKFIAEAAGPLAGLALTGSTGYVIDSRDLFEYGDQFLNFDPADTDKNLLPLPTVDLQRAYVPTLAAIQELFVTGASAFHVYTDGVCNLSIAGWAKDLTPTRMHVNTA